MNQMRINYGIFLSQQVLELVVTHLVYLVKEMIRETQMVYQLAQDKDLFIMMKKLSKHLSLDTKVYI